MEDLEKTIAEITQRIEKTGDLPVFSASVNRIRQISASPEATAMSLSKEATKDVNLTAKLLRLANSSYYNRGKGKISVISRAVVILGFNTVKNQGSELLIEDISEAGWKRVTRKDFLEKCGANFLIIASLRLGSKAIGFIYADNGVSHRPISAEQHRGFIQFVAQARLAIQVGAASRR